MRKQTQTWGNFGAAGQMMVTLSHETKLVASTGQKERGVLWFSSGHTLKNLMALTRPYLLEAPLSSSGTMTGTKSPSFWSCGSLERIKLKVREIMSGSGGWDTLPTERHWRDWKRAGAFGTLTVGAHPWCIVSLWNSSPEMNLASCKQLQRGNHWVWLP